MGKQKTLTTFYGAYLTSVNWSEKEISLGSDFDGSSLPPYLGKLWLNDLSPNLLADLCSAAFTEISHKADRWIYIDLLSWSVSILEMGRLLWPTKRLQPTTRQRQRKWRRGSKTRSIKRRGGIGICILLCDQFLQGNSGVPCAGCHSQADAVPEELDDEKR